MKVLFVTKPFVIEPLGLMSLSAAIKRAGHEADLALTSEDLETKVKTYKPKFIGYSIITGNQNFYDEINRELKQKHSFVSVAGGPHPTFFPEMLEKLSFDVICRGEGEQAIVDLLENPKSTAIPNLWFKSGKGVIANPVRPLAELDTLPHPDRELVFKYPQIREGPIKHFIASRGCPFNCFAGDTLVNTLEGDIPIKDLVGKKKISIFTMNPVTGEVFITDAINCRKTRKNADIVRVTFDDRTFIDCTPDHKFLVFKNGNQFNNTIKWEIEAKNLKPKMSVHAIKFYKTPQGYIEVSWGRRKANKLHRMIYEYYNNEKLTNKDHIHHIDKNKENNDIKNLLKTDNHKHFKLFHPEISERMKENNPTKNMTSEWRENIMKSTIGRKRTIKTKLIQSNNQLGKKNSNYRKDLKNEEIFELYRQGYSMKKIANKFKTNAATIFHRLHNGKIINHKVVSVTPTGKADVYDLEVPATHWFFANNVLVHNCSYCFNESYFELYRGKGKRVRFRSVDDVLKEVEEVVSSSPTRLVYFQDDTFILDKKWLKRFTEEYQRRIKLPFHCHTRANLVTEEVADDLKSAGCYSAHIAAEAGNERVRREILNRDMSNEQITSAVEMLKKRGIKVMLQNILGLPFTTLADDFATLELNIACRPDYAWASIFQPYPRTALGERCVREGIYTGDFSDIGDSFFDKSVIDIPHKNEVANLQKLFAIAVAHPGLYRSGGLQRMITRPHEQVREKYTKAYKAFRQKADEVLYGFKLSG